MRPNAGFAAGKRPKNLSPVLPGKKRPTWCRESPVDWCSLAIPWPSARGRFSANRPTKSMPGRCCRYSAGASIACLSGLCLWNVPGGNPRVRVAVTRLRMDRLSAVEIDDYLASGLWDGKAGAFGYQDRLGWVHVVEGSETNVVGLPMELLAEMLATEVFRMTIDEWRCAEKDRIQAVGGHSRSPNSLGSNPRFLRHSSFRFRHFFTPPCP